VIADSARAEIAIRLVNDGNDIRAAVQRAMAGRAEARELVSIPAMRFNSFDGLPSTIVAYTTDVPAFAGAWGEPFLLGPGSIHVAHTAEERVAKKQLLDAVEIYERMVKQLLAAS
jgi:acetylornithine deacetylase